MIPAPGLSPRLLSVDTAGGPELLRGTAIAFRVAVTWREIKSNTVSVSSVVGCALANGRGL